MKSLRPLSCLFGFLLALPATGAEVWVGTIPAHTIVCASEPVSLSDSDALAQAEQTFFAHWPENRLGDLGSLFGREAETPEKVLLCAQYFGGNAPPPEGFALRAVAASSGLFAFCLGADTEACNTRLRELLGNEWRGERWSRPRYGWVKPDAPSQGTIPPHAELEQLTAASGSRFTPPDAESELRQVGQLIVARLSEEDTNRIRTQLAQTPATPTPAASPTQPPPGEPR